MEISETEIDMRVVVRIRTVKWNCRYDWFQRKLTGKRKSYPEPVLGKAIRGTQGPVIYLPAPISDEPPPGGPFSGPTPV